MITDLTKVSEYLYEMPQPPGIFGAELFERALEYLAAFKRLVPGEETDLKYAGYFVLAHSLELALKAYLAANGTSKAHLQKLSHDLLRSYGACTRLGMPEPPELATFVRSLQEMNRHYDFRYPSGYRLSVPPPAFSIETMNALLELTRKTVWQAHAEAQLRWAADTRHLKGASIRWSD